MHEFNEGGGAIDVRTLEIEGGRGKVRSAQNGPQSNFSRSTLSDSHSTHGDRHDVNIIREDAREHHVIGRCEGLIHTAGERSVMPHCIL